jgi:hypothetical protein
VIRVTFMDGVAVDVAATEWLLDGPVLRIGTWVAPTAQIRWWQHQPAQEVTPDGDS